MAGDCVIGVEKGQCPEDVLVGQVKMLGEMVSKQKVFGSVSPRSAHLWKCQDSWLTSKAEEFFMDPGLSN